MHLWHEAANMASVFLSHSSVVLDGAQTTRASLLQLVRGVEMSNGKTSQKRPEVNSES